MSESVKYSTVRGSPSKTKTNTLSSQQSSNNSALKTQTYNKSVVSSRMKTPSLKKTASTIKSSARTAQTKTKSAVKTVAKTLSPIVTPVVSVLKSVEKGFEKSAKETMQTIRNSPVTKRFNKLLIIPIKENGVNIISLMIIIFGIVVVYNEANKDFPEKTETKKRIGNIVYETFFGGTEAFTEGNAGNAGNAEKTENQENQGKKENNKNKEEDCPPLSEVSDGKTSFQAYSPNPECLIKRCKELKPETCDLTGSCVRIPGNSCTAGNKDGPIGQDVDYYYYKGNCAAGNCPITTPPPPPPSNP